MFPKIEAGSPARGGRSSQFPFHARGRGSAAIPRAGPCSRTPDIHDHLRHGVRGAGPRDRPLLLAGGLPVGMSRSGPATLRQWNQVLASWNEHGVRPPWPGWLEAAPGICTPRDIIKVVPSIDFSIDEQRV